MRRLVAVTPVPALVLLAGLAGGLHLLRPVPGRRAGPGAHEQCPGDRAALRSPPEPTDSTEPTDAPDGTAGADPETDDFPGELPVRYAVSVPGLAAQEHRGDRLRLGAVRERTAAYTSYDVTYRSRSTSRTARHGVLPITGVLNVPTGRGPFPAVVLAHGYIDPAVYERGQGMTRERGYLAQRGYVALHVDYRNHAESDDDPRVPVAGCGWATSPTSINAVKALRRTRATSRSTTTGSRCSAARWAAG